MCCGRWRQSHQTNCTEFPRTHTQFSWRIFFFWLRLRAALRRHVHIQGMVQVKWKIKANVEQWSIVGCCENIYVLFLVFSEKGFYSFLFCFLHRDNVAHCFRFVLFSFIILCCDVDKEREKIQRWQRTMRQIRTETVHASERTGGWIMAFR